MNWHVKRGLIKFSVLLALNLFISLWLGNPYVMAVLPALMFFRTVFSISCGYQGDLFLSLFLVHYDYVPGGAYDYPNGGFFFGRTTREYIKHLGNLGKVDDYTRGQ